MRGRFLAPSVPLGLTAEKYSFEPLGSAFMDLEPSCQFAGQTPPSSSSYSSPLLTYLARADGFY